MSRAGVLQEVRVMRFEWLLDRHERGELSQVEAAELLGVGERTFRRWRERYADERLCLMSSGMLLHQDGSRHEWLKGHRPLDLIVTMDDATSAIYSAFLVEEEGTASSFRGLREVVAAHGLFCSLYTDRGSHYFHTAKAGERVSKSLTTQVGRALAQLGIEHIAAYSPQARGRSERAFRTLQDRLPKELGLAGIATIDAANRWLREVYIAMHNAAFAVEAEQAGSGFVADAAGAWRQALCVQEERTVGADNTVMWRQRALQLPASPLRPHFVRANVRVQEDPDGRVTVYLGPHRLADFDDQGRLIAAQQAPRATLPRRPPIGRGMPRPIGNQKRTNHELQNPANLTS